MPPKKKLQNQMLFLCFGRAIATSQNTKRILVFRFFSKNLLSSYNMRCTTLRINSSNAHPARLAPPRSPPEGGARRVVARLRRASDEMKGLKPGSPKRVVARLRRAPDEMISLKIHFCQILLKNR